MTAKCNNVLTCYYHTIILNKYSHLLTDNFLQDQIGNKQLLFQLIYIRSKIKICQHFYGYIRTSARSVEMPYLPP